MSQPLSRSRLTGVKRLLARSLSLLVVFALGIVCARTWTSLDEKANLLEGASTNLRKIDVIGMISDVGLSYFQPCSQKVELLHEMITSPTSPDPTSPGLVVTSILLDGDGCNQPLLDLLASDTPLPPIILDRRFRLAHIHGSFISATLGDEQGLALFLLARMNPDRLIPSPDVWEMFNGRSEAEARELAVILWKDQLIVNDKE